ncbi:UNVERIFIED_CONTAM: hypothetical protein Scaly_1055100 [Sesamum calycinum]|uniref:Uncharacterized protein n=1 Tax=Sesamum calycinum TaxID=2727403 RepID=A0AAW2QKH6_9LAMI
MTEISNFYSMRLVLRLEKSWKSRAHKNRILDMASDDCVMRHGHHKPYQVQSKYIVGTTDFKRGYVTFDNEKKSLGAARAVRRQPTGSELGPPCPALRANPFPEVTDPFCRLPLPTLFHRPEAVHLGDLMRL